MITFKNIMDIRKPVIVGMSFVAICLVWIGMFIKLSIAFIIYEPVDYVFIRALIVLIVFSILVGYLNGRYEKENKCNN